MRILVENCDICELCCVNNEEGGRTAINGEKFDQPMRGCSKRRYRPGGVILSNAVLDIVDNHEIRGSVDASFLDY